MSLPVASDRTSEARTLTTAPGRPQLRLVDAGRAQVSRVPFLVVCATLLMAGLISVLVLNMTISQNSYTLSQLQDRAQNLDDQGLALQHELDAVSSSGNLAAAAATLGMAPASAPMFLDPSTGTVSGVAAKAAPAHPFTVVTGHEAAAPATTPAASTAAAVAPAAGLGLGGGLLPAVASLAGD